MRLNPNGIWQVMHVFPWPEADAEILNGFDTFEYSQGTVTLRLLCLQLGTPKSVDDFYKLTTRWNGRELTYLPPNGDYQALATFENGHFVDIGNGIKRVFDRVNPDQIHSWNQAILNPRLLHHYGKTP